MNTRLFKVFSYTAILTFLFNSFASAQGTTGISDGRNNPKPAQAEQAEARVQQITTDAGRYFKQGLLNLQDNRRPQARVDFDKSVEVFLLSGINLTSNNNAKARDCYNQLIETVYRMEFPNAQQTPQIRSLSATCGWNVENDLADKVAKLVLTAPTPQTPTNNNSLIASVVPNPSGDLTGGFTEQKFEPSPLDELSKLELTAEEQQVENNPVAQQQYQLVQVAVANKSLGFTFQVHPMIQQYINYYQGRGRSTMTTGLYRSGMFMRMARRIFREEGVPENVAWLGQVESMWKPTAMSWAAASGLWQFIPGTGARFGLKRTAYVDERNSFEGATRASARYLKFLANRYGGNWELAMAAYNCGEGNVDRAISRAGSNFWAAYPYLPKETRNYVPNILATILIANNPQQYGFGQVRPAPQLVYDTVRVPSSTSLALLAQASDTTVEYIRYLNPEFRTNMTPPEPYNVRVPPGKGSEVVAIFKRMPNTKVVNSSTLAKSNTGETWQNISNRTGISVADLMAANPGMATPNGKVIIPFGNRVQSTSYQRPTTQTPTVAATGGVRVVKAVSGDTVAKVAERYGANPVDVANLNGMTSITAALSAGREVKIPVK